VIFFDVPRKKIVKWRLGEFESNNIVRTFSGIYIVEVATRNNKQIKD
jgi:hypothetical protein